MAITRSLHMGYVPLINYTATSLHFYDVNHCLLEYGERKTLIIMMRIKTADAGLRA